MFSSYINSRLKLIPTGGSMVIPGTELSDDQPFLERRNFCIKREGRITDCVSVTGLEFVLEEETDGGRVPRWRL